MYIKYSCAITNVSKVPFYDTHLIRFINRYNSDKKVPKATILNHLWYFNKEYIVFDERISLKIRKIWLISSSNTKN